MNYDSGKSPDSEYLTDLSEESATFSWYAIRTKSNQERVATSVLSGKGYEPYLPLYAVRRRRPDRTIITQRALFPGYVFCRFNPTKRLPILTTTGVISILGFGNEPAPIADSEIEAVERVLRSGLDVLPCPFLREGQRIRINRGCLDGLEGIVLRNSGAFRLVISVTMLQRSISVELDASSLCAI